MTPEQERGGFGTRPLRLMLLGVIAVLCVVVIGFLSTEVRDKLRELAYSPADNMQWTLSQFEVEFLEFMMATDRVDSLPENQRGTARAAALAEMRKRYDILYSRMEILTDSPLYADVLGVMEMGRRYTKVESALRAMVPLIDSPDPVLAEAVPELLQRLEALRPTLRGVLTLGNQALVEMADSTRTDMATVLYRLVIASLVLLVALSLLVLMFRQVAALNEARAREVLATSARLETIVSTSRDAIVVLDRLGQIETANEAAEAMFGERRTALTGQRIGTYLFHRRGEREDPLTSTDLGALCAAADRTALRLIGRSPTTVFPVEVSMNVTDREGASVFVCVIRDISHQVAAEAELKDSRDRALAGERAKARFLGVVSHEMRTPLNGILGAVELMEEAGIEEIHEQYLPVLKSSSSVLLDLVNDVLEITRIEGRVPVDQAAFDLDQLVSMVIETERPRAQGNGNRISWSDDQPVGLVMGDRRRLRQVLMNLVANAAKFTRDGEITVSVERLAEDRVEIQVADNGIGIPEGERESIFDDFVRTDSAVARQIPGTGLGLGIARQLTSSMGGEIEVESIEGEGSLFRVTLPLPVANSAAAAPAIVPVAHGAPLVPLPRLEILLVEDNATNRFVTRRMLARLGHTVTEAHDGAQAVEMTRDRRFDLILMDVSMPRMDGIEATRRIRSGFGANRTTRIVALTAHLGEEVAASLRDAGMDVIVAKPLTGSDLDTVLAESRRSAVRPQPVTSPEAVALPLLETAQTDTLMGGGTPDAGGQRLERFLAEGNALFAGSTADVVPARAADAIHALAGLAAVFGARRLHAALAAAEAQARAGETAALAEALVQARTIWELTCEALAERYPATSAEQDPAARRGAAGGGS